MNYNRVGKWGAGGVNKGVYLYIDEDHKHRMGSCEWLPKDGDLCVCVEHAGDCFSDYVAMRKQENGDYKMIGEFGAYNFGEKISELSNRNFHLLQAGESIPYDKNPVKDLIDNIDDNIDLNEEN